MEENPDLVKAARRGDSVVDPETGLKKPGRGASLVNGEEKDGERKASLVPGAGDRRRPSLITRTESERNTSLVPKSRG